MNYFSENDFLQTTNFIENLPFKINNMYIDDKQIIFECETKTLFFGFDVYYSGNTNIDFNADLYGGNSDLIMCDFRNDIDRNMQSFYQYEINDELHDDDSMFILKTIFNMYIDVLYKYMIYKNNIVEKTKYQKKYNITIDNILYLLEEDGNSAKDINLWAGNCYGISESIMKYINIENLELVYGKWNGYIPENTYFSGRALANHGWLEFKKDNQSIVIDPTRWVFEGVAPYIYISIKSSEYDRAGQQFQKEMRDMGIHNIPEPNNNDKIIDITFGEEIDNYLFNTILEGKYNYFTIRNINYIANTPIDYLMGYEKVIFDILIENGHGVFIPIDTKELIYGRQ